MKAMMKKVEKLLSVICLVSLLLVSCSIADKHTEEIETYTDNFLKVGTVVYELSAGVFENHGADLNNKTQEGYRTDLMLYSNGLTLQKNENDAYLFSGKGNAIHFKMFSSNGKELDNGEYIFSTTAPYQVKTFDYGHFSINLDFDYNAFHTVESEDICIIVDGKVGVTRNGNEYTIIIECTCHNGYKVTGYYKGEVSLIDWPVFN